MQSLHEKCTVFENFWTKSVAAEHSSLLKPFFSCFDPYLFLKFAFGERSVHGVWISLDLTIKN